MPHQLIYTSAPNGLSPGSGGYCTVAKSEGFPEDLTQDLEAASTYDFVPRTLVGQNSAVIHRYQFYRTSASTYFVLSKITDAGFDHTGRTNYLAQHLVLTSADIGALYVINDKLNPATILSSANQYLWRAAWTETPQWLQPLDNDKLYHSCKSGIPSDYKAGEWGTCSGDAVNALALLEAPHNTQCNLGEIQPGREDHLLKFFGETLNLASIGNQAWRYSFTTCLQKGENAEAYTWAGMGGEVAEIYRNAGHQLVDIISGNLKASFPDEDLAFYARNGHERPKEEPLPVPTSTEVAPVAESAAQEEPRFVLPNFAGFVENYHVFDKLRLTENQKGSDQQGQALMQFTKVCKGFLSKVEKSADENCQNPEALQAARQQITDYLQLYENNILKNGKPILVFEEFEANIKKKIFIPAVNLKEKIEGLLAQPQTADVSGKKKLSIMAIVALVVAVLLAGAGGYYYYQQAREAAHKEKVAKEKAAKDKAANKMAANEDPEKKAAEKKAAEKKAAEKKAAQDKAAEKKAAEKKAAKEKADKALLEPAITRYFGKIAEGKTKVRIIYSDLDELKGDEIPLLQASLLTPALAKDTRIFWATNGFKDVDWTKKDFGRVLDPKHASDFLKKAEGDYRPHFESLPNKGRTGFAAVRTERNGEDEILYLCAPNIIPLFGDAFEVGLERKTPGGDPAGFKAPLVEALNNVEVIGHVKVKNNFTKNMYQEQILFAAVPLDQYPYYAALPLGRYPYYTLKGNKWGRVMDEKKREEIRNTDKFYNYFMNGSEFPVPLLLSTDKSFYSKFFMQAGWLKNLGIELSDVPKHVKLSKVEFIMVNEEKIAVKIAEAKLDKNSFKIPKDLPSNTLFKFPLGKRGKKPPPFDNPLNIKFKIKSNPKLAKEYIEGVEKKILDSSTLFFYGRKFGDNFVPLAQFPRKP